MIELTRYVSDTGLRLLKHCEHDNMLMQRIKKKNLGPYKHKITIILPEEEKMPGEIWTCRGGATGVSHEYCTGPNDCGDSEIPKQQRGCTRYLNAETAEATLRKMAQIEILHRGPPEGYRNMPVKTCGNCRNWMPYPRTKSFEQNQHGDCRFAHKVDISGDEPACKGESDWEERE